jgi:hypothetical protein
LLIAESVDSRIVSGTLGATIPGAVVGGAVLVAFPVRFVVFVVVADQIIQREAVVRRNEVDGRPWLATLAIEDVGRSADTLNEFADGRVAFPKIANRIAKLVVPFRPSWRKFANLVATGAAVQGLGNFLDGL